MYLYQLTNIPRNMSKVLSNWLNVVSKNTYCEYFHDSYENKYEDYYCDDDIDVQNSNKYLLKNYEMSDYDVDICVDANDNIKEIYLPENTNRYFCNQLFKNIVDFVSNKKVNLTCVTYVVQNNVKKQIIKTAECKIFDSSNKQNFYNFCYKHTIKPLEKYKFKKQKDTIFYKVLKNIDNPTNIFPEKPLEQNNKKYNDINKILCKKLLDDTRKEINKYEDSIVKIWEIIIYPYINSSNSAVLNKLYHDNMNYTHFVNFMREQHIYIALCELEKIFFYSLE